MDMPELPEDCIAKILSLTTTTPADACRLSLVSKIFRSAADSDTVWTKFFPPDFFSIVAYSRSKKELYFNLCKKPILIHEGDMSFSLEKWSGKKCYMLSARALRIVWGNRPEDWKWISMPNSRFKDVAQLASDCSLEIRGRIDIRMLSPSTLYKAYLVYGIRKNRPPSSYCIVEVTAGFVDRAWGRPPLEKRIVFLWQPKVGRLRNGGDIDEAQYPKKRIDGWLEVELGEFLCQGNEDRRRRWIKMTCMEVEAFFKPGLIVHGIEVRPKTN